MIVRVHRSLLRFLTEGMRRTKIKRIMKIMPSRDQEDVADERFMYDEERYKAEEEIRHSSWEATKKVLRMEGINQILQNENNEEKSEAYDKPDPEGTRRGPLSRRLWDIIGLLCPPWPCHMDDRRRISFDRTLNRAWARRQRKERLRGNAGFWLTPLGKKWARAPASVVGATCRVG